VERPPLRKPASRVKSITCPRGRTQLWGKYDAARSTLTRQTPDPTSPAAALQRQNAICKSAHGAQIRFGLEYSSSEDIIVPWSQSLMGLGVRRHAHPRS